MKEPSGTFQIVALIIFIVAIYILGVLYITYF
jgi:hypothetical protein